MLVEHPTNTGPAYHDADGNPARIVRCPDCGQMEWWTDQECQDHGKCRADPAPCWCEMEAGIGLHDAAQYAGVSYSTMAQAVREGRVNAWRTGPKTWLTCKQDVRDAIESGKLRPRRK